MDLSYRYHDRVGRLPCTIDTDCTDRELCVNGLCGCFSGWGSTGPPDCRGISWASILVATVYIILFICCLMTVLINLLVLVHFAWFARRAPWLVGTVKSQSSSTGGARQEAPALWVLLLMPKTLFLLSSIACFSCRAAVCIFFIEYALGGLNIRKFTYSPLGAQLIVTSLAAVFDYAWLMVVVLAWVMSAVNSGMPRPWFYCGSGRTLLALFIIGIFQLLVMMVSAFKLAFWVPAVWGLLMSIFATLMFNSGVKLLLRGRTTLHQVLLASLPSLRVIPTPLEALDSKLRLVELEQISTMRFTDLCRGSGSKYCCGWTKGEGGSGSGGSSGGSRVAPQPDSSGSSPRTAMAVAIATTDDGSPLGDMTEKEEESRGGWTKEEWTKMSAEIAELKRARLEGVFWDVARLAVRLILVCTISAMALIAFGCLYYFGSSTGGLDITFMTIIFSISEFARVAGNILALLHMSRWLRSVIWILSNPRAPPPLDVKIRLLEQKLRDRRRNPGDYTLWSEFDL